MIDTEIYNAALDGLKSHKLRSILTALGVIFGVAAVIGMASIGEGAKREAMRQIEALGATSIIVEYQNAPDESSAEIAINRNPRGLTMEDAESLQMLIKNEGVVIPLRIEEKTVSAADVRSKHNVNGSVPNHLQVLKSKLESGRWLTDKDTRDATKVAILGWGAKRTLFPIDDALNQEFRIANQLFTVVGVLERQWSGGEIQGFELKDQNNDIYIPLTSMLTRFSVSPGSSELSKIHIQMNSTDGLYAFADIIDRAIDRRHREVKDFQVIVPIELLKQQQQTQNIFNIVMGTIASISLIVGGIGIMNIMLASVLERTREIGIRRAVGATQGDITKQFLMESVLLSIMGGIIGVIFGMGLAYAISMYAGWQTAVSVWSIFLAVFVSAGVGIIFGWLPARSAAKLDPITALRFE